MGCLILLVSPCNSPREVVSDAHSGGWAPDGKALVYTRDTDNFDIYVIENYR